MFYKPDTQECERNVMLTDFDCRIIVGFRWDGGSISETNDLLGFTLHNSVRKTSSELQICGRKHLVNEKGQRRMARFVQTDG